MDINSKLPPQLHGESDERYERFIDYLNIPKEHRKSITSAHKYWQESTGKNLSYNNYAIAFKDFQWEARCNSFNRTIIKDREEEVTKIALDTRRTTQNVVDVNEHTSSLLRKAVKEIITYESVLNYITNADGTPNLAKAVRLNSMMGTSTIDVEKIKNGVKEVNINILPEVVGALLTPEMRVEMARLQRQSRPADDGIEPIEVTATEVDDDNS